MSIGALMALVIIAIMLAISIRTINPAISSIISAALCLMIIGICVSRIGAILDSIKGIFANIKLDETYLLILLKLIGIAYICEFASGISKDAGYGAVASHIELLGKLTMLMVSLPVFIQVIETIGKIM